ncbi:SgcJ/EcaC family oxidoreductase [Stackebrandtia nassauensis]|uniref:DUF4440 domain-containing protein n=1 Tax=Stackebrandtia nassauensis (strain DSM 44728 / CIP 108903 / NRRL B-16338 / NBRC 102104 / LLR-40K-21) TaxID=446470 RepID=D3Q2Z4_STANL|nr:SgcJ/EcaC family oxidoreductase [Stackebrandtia nassauensis]ADD39964.1 hypothetical protein Snas_0246 [Stackebrandtia nassauensis DSM 44728]
MRTISKIGAVAAVAVALLGGVATVAVAEGGAAGTTAAQREKEARDALERLRERQFEAWDEKDGAAFASTFAKDGDMVTFNGDHLATRAGIASGMQYYFDNFIEDTTIELLDEKVRFVDGKLAIVVRTTCLVRDGESECRDGSDSVNTNVMAKRHGVWEQQSFQNTRIDPIE